MFYTILIPTNTLGRLAPRSLVDAILVEVKQAMAAAFGGYTETVGSGGYVSQSGDLVEEVIYQIESFATEANDGLVIGLAEMVKTKLRQESVMVKIGKEVRFL